MKFRTYKRRDATRESGFHVSGETTGSQCKIKESIYFCDNNSFACLKFFRKTINLVDIFSLKQSMLAIGFYIFPENEINLSIKIIYTYQNSSFENVHDISLKSQQWNKVGVHDLINIDLELSIYDISVELIFNTITDKKTSFNIYGFDFDIVSQPHYIDNELAWIEFLKKTTITVPEIYYLDHELPLNKYLVSPDPKAFNNGKVIVLKSCNRCSRYLPININDERLTLAFSNHCVSCLLYTSEAETVVATK